MEPRARANMRSTILTAVARKTPASTEADPRVGMRLGAFEVKAIIEDGDLVSFFDAQDLRTGEPATLEVVSAATASSMPEVADSFVREAELARALGDPGYLCPFVDFGREADASCWRALRTLHGITLSEAWSKPHEGPDHDQVVRMYNVALQLSSALAHMHNHDVVVGQLLPENVLVAEIDGEDAVVILDVDQAVVIDPGAIPLAASPPMPPPPPHAYTPPEIARGSKASPRADVYVVARLLRDGLALAMGQPTDDPESVPAWLSGTEIGKVLTRALSAEPAARFATAEELFDALGEHPPWDLIGRSGSDTIVTSKYDDFSDLEAPSGPVRAARPATPRPPSPKPAPASKPTPTANASSPKATATPPQSESSSKSPADVAPVGRPVPSPPRPMPAPSADVAAAVSMEAPSQAPAPLPVGRPVSSPGAPPPRPVPSLKGLLKPKSGEASTVQDTPVATPEADAEVAPAPTNESIAPAQGEAVNKLAFSDLLNNAVAVASFPSSEVVSVVDLTAPPQPLAPAVVGTALINPPEVSPEPSPSDDYAVAAPEEQVPEPPSPPAPVEPVAPPFVDEPELEVGRKRGPGLIIAVVAALLLVGGGAGWWLTRGPSEAQAPDGAQSPSTAKGEAEGPAASPQDPADDETTEEPVGSSEAPQGGGVNEAAATGDDDEAPVDEPDTEPALEDDGATPVAAADSEAAPEGITLVPVDPGASEVVWMLSTTPPGATAHLGKRGRKVLCRPTPCEARLPRGGNTQLVRLRLEGFADEVIELDLSQQGTYSQTLGPDAGGGKTSGTSGASVDPFGVSIVD